MTKKPYVMSSNKKKLVEKFLSGKHKVSEIKNLKLKNGEEIYTVQYEYK